MCIYVSTYVPCCDLQTAAVMRIWSNMGRESTNNGHKPTKAATWRLDTPRYNANPGIHKIWWRQRTIVLTVKAGYGWWFYDSFLAEFTCLVVKLSNSAPGWLGAAHPKLCFGCSAYFCRKPRLKTNSIFRYETNTYCRKNGSNYINTNNNNEY